LPVAPTQSTTPEPEPVESTDVLSATDPVSEKPASTTKETTVVVATTSSSTPAALTATDTPKPAFTQTSVAKPVKELPTFTESTIATSSGLIALIEQATTTEDAIIAGIATRPNSILQIVYTLFGFIVIGLLVGAAVIEIRRDRYIQVAYSLGLLAVMGGLWYIHALLTGGAVIV
jgi:hypothetical protein